MAVVDETFCDSRFEFLFEKNAAHRLFINGEIARRFSPTMKPQFINGILDAVKRLKPRRSDGEFVSEEIPDKQQTISAAKINDLLAAFRRAVARSRLQQMKSAFHELRSSSSHVHVFGYIELVRVLLNSRRSRLTARRTA